MSLFDGVGKLRGGLDYHLARQNVLVANLSHLDTPGYRPLDLQRTQAEGSFAQALHTEMAVTDPAHLGGERQISSEQFGKIVNDPTAQAGADGNAVNVDREGAKIAANQVRYDVLSRLVAGELNGLAWAANDGKNG